MGDFLDFAGGVVEVLNFVDQGVVGSEDGFWDSEDAFDSS
jgi:hypothetical protein